MKTVNLISNSQQKGINISILDKHYKFETLPFKLDESNNYFEVYGTRIIRENKLSVVCDIKSLRGNISDIKFNFESLDKELTLRHYIQYQNQVEFINKLSLNYNNKNWFNIEENSLGVITPRELIIGDMMSVKNGLIKINNLEETCILNNKITENFSEIPIYWYDKNVNQNIELL